MKIRSIATLIVIFAFLLSGCGQVAPPNKGGSGGDNKQQENAEKRIYWFDDNTRTETKMGIVYSINLDCKDKRQELEIPKPEPQSDYVVKSNLDFGVGSLSVISISKNKKFILTSAEIIKNFDIENGETYLVDGKKVEGIEVNEYSIYEPSTKEFHYIGALCKYEFNIYPPQTIKEIGHKYYPAGWLDDELLLVETTKDEKIYTEDQDAAVKVSESIIEVPYATAKAVSFSLKDFTLSPTDKFKPIKPWASYSDSCTGIVGYFDPFYPFTKALYLYYPETYEMRYPGFNTVITTLSDLKGTKNYDLYNLAEKALPKDYALGRSFFLGSMIDKNNKKMCYYIMEGYQKNVKNDEKAKHEYIVFGLDFNTGNIKKYMDMNRINSEVKKFVKFPDKITDITISHAYTLDGLTFTKETGPTFFFRCLVRYKDTINPSTKYMEFLIYGPNLDKLKKMETSFPFRFEYYCIR